MAVLFFTAGNGSLHFRELVMDLAVLAESCTNGFSELVSQSASAVTTFLFNRIMMKLLGEDGVCFRRAYGWIFRREGDAGL